MPLISPPPVRNNSGTTSDLPWMPLADCGWGNPFFYHGFADDFDASIQGSWWNTTKTGNGTIAHTAGDGGLLLFTTNSSSPAGTDICSMQLAAASFTVTVGKKMFFLCRLQVSDATNAAFNVGLIQTTTTPFTVTDGIYFNKASGAANNLTLYNDASSAHTNTLTIPTGAYTLANNTNIDLAFYVDRNGQINAFVNGNMVGYFNNSGTGSANPNRGPVITTSGATTFTTANLNVTIAVQSGTASSKTMTGDFIMVAKER